MENNLYLVRYPESWFKTEEGLAILNSLDYEQTYYTAVVCCSNEEEARNIFPEFWYKRDMKWILPKYFQLLEIIYLGKAALNLKKGIVCAGDYSTHHFIEDITESETSKKLNTEDNQSNIEKTIRKINELKRDIKTSESNLKAICSHEKIEKSISPHSPDYWFRVYECDVCRKFQEYGPKEVAEPGSLKSLYKIQKARNEK